MHFIKLDLMRELLGIALFGLLGIFSRYGIDRLALQVTLPIPIHTLGINLLGSFLAGVVFVIGTEKGLLPIGLRPGLMVGFLGGFTTFSAYALQCAILTEKKAYGPTLIYWIGSPVLGLFAALTGLWITRFVIAKFQ